MGAFGVKWRKKKLEKRHFFRREGAIALARLYHISGTATPIELKFSGMFKIPKKSLNMKNQLHWNFFRDFMAFFAFFYFGIIFSILCTKHLERIFIEKNQSISYKMGHFICYALINHPWKFQINLVETARKMLREIMAIL